MQVEQDPLIFIQIIVNLMPNFEKFLRIRNFQDRAGQPRKFWREFAVGRSHSVSHSVSHGYQMFRSSTVRLSFP